MRCSTCGAEVADGVKFCEICGTPLQRGAQSTGGVQPASAQSAGDFQPASAQPTSGAYGQQGYEAPHSYEPAAGGSAASWEGTRQTVPALQATSPKQGSSAPFVLAIIALVTALLGLFPISLVLAIIALVMNRGQKKRGEQSTKQTPTFVMALVSLILSILVALATVALGGLVWLAVMDDEIDLDHVTESTEPTQAAPAESPAGVWTVVSLTDGDDTYDEEYLKLMEGKGISFELVIAEDGTASLEFFDESETGTWEDRGSGKVAITFDGDTVEGTVSGDELTLSYDGDDMVLRRSSKAAPATAGDSSSDESEASSSSSASASGSASSESASASGAASSESTSASASASSESTSAAEQVADSHDADDEPTLGDFTWYAGAGGIPEGADILTSIYDVEGTWKAYIFGDGMERLCTLSIEPGQADATATIDWLYVHDSSTDRGSEDDTPDSVFSGDWDGALGLEALGPGRLALTDFWQQGDRQYGMGSFMWPSGETAMVLLVRP